MNIITSHLRMRKQNQKVKEELQSLTTGVWVEPKSITPVFASGSLCSGLRPSTPGLCRALRLWGLVRESRTAGPRPGFPLETGQWKNLHSRHELGEQCCWKGFHEFLPLAQRGKWGPERLSEFYSYFLYSQFILSFCFL